MTHQPADHSGPPTVRQQLPVRRLHAVVVRGLDAPGDATLGSEPLRGLDFTVEAGTLTLLAPPAAARTLVLYLSGDVPDRFGERRTGRTRCRTVRQEVLADITVGEHLAAAGHGAHRPAALLGLEAWSDLRASELDPLARTLTALALALADGPDVVALDDPFRDLDPPQQAVLTERVRDLVDSDGRTVLITCDLSTVPTEALALADRRLTLIESEGRDRLLAFVAWRQERAPEQQR